MNLKSIFYHAHILLNGTRSLSQIMNYRRFKQSQKIDILPYQPLILSIPPTDRCNLKCKMCQTHSSSIPSHEFRHKPTKDMTFELFKMITATFKKALEVQFIGTGEPLLNKDLFQMIKYAHKKKFDVSVVTNGVLIDRHLDLIMDSPINELTISINGHNREEFSRMTGLSTEFWLRIRENIDRINKRNKREFILSLSFIVDKTNIKSIQEMINFGNKVGADRLLFVNFLPSKIKGFTKEERTVFIEDFDPINAKKTLIVPKGMTVTLPRPIDKVQSKKICRNFFNTIRIDGAGNIGGCPRQLLALEENGCFTDPNVWNNDYFVDMRRKFLHDDLDLPEPCTWCFSNSPHDQIVVKG